MTQTHVNAFSMALLGVAFLLLLLTNPPLPVCWRQPRPVGHDPQLLVPGKSDVEIQIDAEPRGPEYRLREIWLDREDFPRILGLDRLAESRPGKNRRATIKADSRLPVGDVLDVVRAARTAGYEHVFLVTDVSSDSPVLGLASRRWLKAHVVD